MKTFILAFLMLFGNKLLCQTKTNCDLSIFPSNATITAYYTDKKEYKEFITFKINEQNLNETEFYSIFNNKNICFYSSDSILLESNRYNQKGMKNGNCFLYYYNGNIKQSIVYEENKIIQCFNYDPNGNIILKDSLLNGNGKYFDFAYIKEKLYIKSETIYKDGVKNGKEIIYKNYPNDTLNIIYNYPR